MSKLEQMSNLGAFNDRSVYYTKEEVIAKANFCIYNNEIYDLRRYGEYKFEKLFLRVNCKRICVAEFVYYSATNKYRLSYSKNAYVYETTEDAVKALKISYDSAVKTVEKNKKALSSSQKTLSKIQPIADKYIEQYPEWFI